MIDDDQAGPSAVAMTIGDVGLLHIRSRPEVEFSVSEAQEALEWAGQVSGKNPKPFLVNLSGTAKVSPKVFHHFANRMAPNDAVALAVVVDSPVMASIGRVVWGRMGLSNSGAMGGNLYWNRCGGSRLRSRSLFLD